MTPWLAALLFLAVRGACAPAQEVPVFDVHFAVITASPQARRVATPQSLRREVDILNRHFIDSEGRPVVRFRFKEVRIYEEISHSSCRFVSLGDTTEGYDSDAWAELFNACADPRVRDPRAVNFYVYDSHSQSEGFADDTGHGKRNSGRPYVLLDWARLGHRGQAPEEHEMGHAFGLDHVCVPGARPDSSTNIMASSECGKGSGGRRDLGFTPDQARAVRAAAARVAARLGG